MHSFVQPRDCPFTLGAGEERTRRELGFLPENTCPDSEKIDRSVDQSINPRNKRPDFGSGIFRRHATHHFPSIAPAQTRSIRRVVAKRSKTKTQKAQNRIEQRESLATSVKTGRPTKKEKKKMPPGSVSEQTTVW
mmetsp:Transcript_25130/g.53552  ORF Transcript_25130/g.53552 Transcript_25130/m.53552 type:complete len:135 (+) Transcript_25130:288-692(+)